MCFDIFICSIYGIYSNGSLKCVNPKAEQF